MLMEINKSLTGVPVDLVFAMAGHGNPHAVMLPEEERQPRKIGAAIACFISAYKTFGRNS